MDDSFNHEVFFRNIVKLFKDDPKDDWVIETLKWWNECVNNIY